MAHPSTFRPHNRFEEWFDARLPVQRVVHDQFVTYPTPRNLNYWWTFGMIPC